MNEYELAVERGVTLLNEQYPGWASEIDLGRLFLGDSELCILGQLFSGTSGHYNGYEAGCEYFRLRVCDGDCCRVDHPDRDSSTKYGFNAAYNDPNYDSFNGLTDLWKKAIKKIREEESISQ